MHRVAIALGSNLKDRLGMLTQAFHAIAEDVIENPQSSFVYETAPWGFKDQPQFLNAVVCGDSGWEAPSILNYLKSLERHLGRQGTVKNGPREIDLDLICIGEQSIYLPGVEVPHPRMTDRAFVILPLCDVWSDWIHPIKKISARRLLETIAFEDRCNCKSLNVKLVST